MLIQSASNTDDAESVKNCVSLVPDHIVEELNEMLDEMMEAGFIIKSETMWCLHTHGG